MFTGSPVSATQTAGALSTEDVNAYQAVGALTVVSVVGASTLGMAIAAPVPVIGTIACGAGLLYYGSRTNGADAEATTEAPEAPEADRTNTVVQTA